MRPALPHRLPLSADRALLGQAPGGSPPRRLPGDTAGPVGRVRAWGGLARPQPFPFALCGSEICRPRRQAGNHASAFGPRALEFRGQGQLVSRTARVRRGAGQAPRDGPSGRLLRGGGRLPHARRAAPSAVRPACLHVPVGARAFLPLRVWSVRTGPPCFPRLRPHTTLSRSRATPNPQRFMLVASSVGTGEGAVGAASCVSPSLCPWRSGAHPVSGQAALCKLKPSKSISKGSLIRNGRTRICHFKGSSFPPHRWKALLF